MTRALLRDPRIEAVVPSGYRNEIRGLAARLGVPQEEAHRACFTMAAKAADIRLSGAEPTALRLEIYHAICNHYAMAREISHYSRKVSLSDKALVGIVASAFNEVIGIDPDLEVFSRRTWLDIHLSVPVKDTFLDVDIHIQKKFNRVISIGAELRLCPTLKFTPRGLLGILKVAEADNDEGITDIVRQNVAELQIVIELLNEDFPDGG